MSYGEVTEFLRRKTNVVELTNDRGARVAVCPDWQGRVMTSTCGGLDGDGFGFVNRPFIEAGQTDPRFNNYGGEDRFWLSPEGGPFSLWFKPKADQTPENWFTPSALNEGVWEVVSKAHDPDCVMATGMKFRNASATEFELEVARRVRLLRADDLARFLGPAAAETLADPSTATVAFETINEITNVGSPFTRRTGAVSIWILGMLRSGPRTVVVVPYRPGAEAELGPVVKSDYFGPIPDERLKIASGAVLFMADGGWRSKIGTSQRRARNVLGSIDFSAGVLTLVQFTLPDDPAGRVYLNNMWGFSQPEPFVGDVANSYNDGPSPADGQPGAFYELESLSPAPMLQTGESLIHRHRTLHVQADSATLGRLSQSVLGVDLESVRRAMITD